MKDVTLRQLEYLVAVAEEGSISRGAARCHVSPVAVGQALDDLERTLGATLTRRQRSKGVALTVIGGEIVRHAREVLHSVDRLPLLIDAAAERMKPTLRIGSFPTLSGWAVPPIIAEFSRHHPGVTIELLESDYETLHEGLRHGTLDILIGFQNHVKPGVQMIPIAPVQLRAIVSTEHRLADRRSARLAELADEDIIINALYPVSELLTELLERHGVAHAIRWRTTSTDVIKNLIGRNLAVSPVVSPGLSFISSEGRPLAAVPLTGDLPPQAVVACVAEDVPVGPAHRAVVDILRQHSTTTLNPPGASIVGA
ncbi:LysR family transcriptional regulator [Corynebacterium halotolerans]|uniref:LysR family transcriptional regulator n=1 Tax=Corynebacterium halotolerans YIM 70093 = DSM 44683 TaxID=1121362 RepID=M1PAP5_9CORY|nr:LysR family transcriptional regulator [Corynebacterium halotolerans]AGF73756.1 LysR family transcriptional regulator [Corynebacterium halotolerans YIM 70093 = DSM 44683]